MKLNEKQEIAKNKIDGPMLIIAGAGSGKTATLTARVEHMIKEVGIDPKSILCVTFTNKAAKEMRERIGKTLGIAINNNIYRQRNLPLIGTFHSIGVFFLREVLDNFDSIDVNIGIKREFLIYSEDDKFKLIKEIIVNDLKLEEKSFPVRKMAYFISEAKNNFLNAKKYKSHIDSYIKEKVSMIYDIYEKKMIENNALDFDDILFKTLELLKLQNINDRETNFSILEYFQEKYKYIMVDEYQDTNLLQYEIIKLLASKYKNLAVVGDDWQSIYSWRGADMRNILNFKKDYPEALVVKLEQNYRSTKYIIDAANCVVKNNKTALDKTLWTDNETGEKIYYIESLDDSIEAETIAKIIKEKQKEQNFPLTKETRGILDENISSNNQKLGELNENLKTNKSLSPNKYSDNLILYRTNGQSRQIEEALMKNGIPYKVVGGLKFYDRKEIKDLIGYLRVIHNQNDIISFKRIINTPSRKIGTKTLEVLDIYRINFNLSYFQILQNASEIADLNSGAKNSINNFVNLMLNLIENSNRMELAKFIDYIIEKTGYKEYLQAEYSKEEYEGKLDNINELINLASNYNGIEPREALSQFLEEISLVSDLDNIENDSDYVTLMTIHTSKGLEQKRVFIAGVEESIFPHVRSVDSPSELEEERRLMYVAMTRAKKELYISRAKERFYFGNYVRNQASRFIKEIPSKFLENYENNTFSFSKGENNFGEDFFNQSNISGSNKESQYKAIPKIRETNNLEDFSVGDKLSHHKFGTGIITELNGEIAQIAFENKGIVKMNIKIAPVKKI